MKNEMHLNLSVITLHINSKISQKLCFLMLVAHNRALSLISRKCHGRYRAFLFIELYSLFYISFIYEVLLDCWASRELLDSEILI